MKRPLRCYLFRAGLALDDALSEGGIERGDFYRFTGGGLEALESLEGSELGEPSPGQLVVAAFSDTTGTPWWQEQLAQELDLRDLVVGPTPTRGVIVFCATDDPSSEASIRWIAWTFGSGSRYLRRHHFEPRFGVISALNRVIGAEGGEALLRKMQYRQQGAYRQRVGHIASSDTPLVGFRMDRVRDLLAAAGGKPPDDNAQVFGARNLVFRTDVTNLVKTVSDESPAVMRLYREDHYQADFGFIDNYIPVEDREVIDALESALAAELDRGADTIDVVYPDDILDFNDEQAIEYVLYPRERTNAASRTVFTIDMARQLFAADPAHGVDVELRFTDADRNVVGNVPLRDCLTGELSLAGERYYLADGTYYHVAAEFIEQIDQALLDLTRWDEPLPRYGGGREDDWIAEVAASGGFADLDGTRIHLPGQTPFEPADLVHTSGALLHVKRKGRSSALSYLFTQASVSSQLLGNPDAVTDLRKLIDEHAPEAIRDEIQAQLRALDRSRPDLEVVLTIIGDWHQRNASHMPLIAKLELHATTQAISQHGFRPRLALVPLVSRP